MTVCILVQYDKLFNLNLWYLLDWYIPLFYSKHFSKIKLNVLPFYSLIICAKSSWVGVPNKVASQAYQFTISPVNLCKRVESQHKKQSACFLLCILRLLIQCIWEQEWRWAMPPCRIPWWQTAWRTSSTATTWESRVRMWICFHTAAGGCMLHCITHYFLFDSSFISWECCKAVGCQSGGTGQVCCQVSEQNRSCTEGEVLWSGDCPHHGAIQKR